VARVVAPIEPAFELSLLPPPELPPLELPVAPLVPLFEPPFELLLEPPAPPFSPASPADLPCSPQPTIPSRQSPIISRLRALRIHSLLVIVTADVPRGISHPGLDKCLRKWEIKFTDQRENPP
jgi:hypothetical protein